MSEKGFVSEGSRQTDDPSVESFLHDKRQTINASNVEEFIDTVEGAKGEPETARCAARLIDRNVHIRSTAVDNQDGPLSRSILSSTSGTLVSPHGTVAASGERVHFDGLEERVRNLETHMGIVVAPLDKSLAERVKVLEDKILKIEEFYPQIAAHVFNYGRAEVEASLRPGGRVSRMPGITTSTTASAVGKRDGPDEDEVDVDQGVDDSSLGELRRRMDELKSRLLKQAAKNKTQRLQVMGGGSPP